MKKNLLRPLKLLLFVFYAVSISIFILLPYTDGNFIKGSDLVSFVTGAKIISAGKSNLLYDSETQFSYQKALTGLTNKKFLLPFRNPPLVSYLYLPFTRIPLNFSFFIVQLINLVLITASLYLLKEIQPRLQWGTLIPLFFFWPVINALFLGQMTPVFLFIFAAIYYLIKKQKAFVAGLLLGVLSIKPQLLIFLPYIFLISSNKKSFTQGVLLSLSLAFIVNFSIGGTGLLTDYLGFLRLTESADFGSRFYQMFSLYPLQQIIFGLSETKNLVYMAVNILLYLTSLYFFHKSKPEEYLETKYSLAILSTMIFLPHLLSHDLILSVIPIAFSYLRARTVLNSSLVRAVLYFGPLSGLINANWIFGIVLTVLTFKLLFQIINKPLLQKPIKVN